MSDGKLGIADLKPVLGLAIELGNVIDKMGHTEGVAKYGQLLMLVDELAGLGSVKFDQIVPEFKDLDDAEKAELMAYVKEKLSLEDKDLEGKIEGGLGLIQKTIDLVNESIAFVKDLKAS